MTFYFYDLETSGLNPRSQRIMQFAGQRTDENLQPIGEPQNWLVKLTDEVLPDPEAILLTGITPQKMLEEGYTEAAFLELFSKEALQADTVIVGYNNISFDDEFMRMTLWRNFYDPYEWQWQEGRSRWDLLDVVRMVRALRPEGITWPNDTKGEPTNRLELMTKANNLLHDGAHDALSDVQATIALAKLLRSTQPKIFDYLLKMRSKQAVAPLVSTALSQPFVHTCSRFSNKWFMTSAVVALGNVREGASLIYDLRQDPSELVNLSDNELQQKAFEKDPMTEILPVTTMKVNACPAIAPLGVLDDDSQARLGLTVDIVSKHHRALRAHPELVKRLLSLAEQMNEQRQQSFKGGNKDPDFSLYDGFIDEDDKTQAQIIRGLDQKELRDFKPSLTDSRLKEQVPRYKARNFPSSLSSEDREAWEHYKKQRLLTGVYGQLPLKDYLERITSLGSSTNETKQFLLQELLLYAESIAPLEV